MGALRREGRRGGPSSIVDGTIVDRVRAWVGVANRDRRSQVVATSALDVEVLARTSDGGLRMSDGERRTTGTTS